MSDLGGRSNPSAAPPDGGFTMSWTELVTLLLMDAWRTITGRNRPLDEPEEEGSEQEDDEEERDR
jgi:hypothetical protein